MSEMTIDLGQLLSFARDIAEEAGQYILKVIREEDIQVKWKSSPTDLVTHVDQEVERRLIARINEEYPDHTIVGEEGLSEVDDQAEYRWFIDPIDGTTNFVHQQINYCVSIAVYNKNTGLVGVVYDPSRNEMFWAAKGMGAYLNGKPLKRNTPLQLEESLVATNLIWVGRTRKWGLESQVYQIARRCRGIRSLGAAALELAYVAAGRIDAFLSLHLSPWDFAAGKVIIEEAGGKLSDFSGREIALTREKFGLLASHSDIHAEMLELLKKE